MWSLRGGNRREGRVGWSRKETRRVEKRNWSKYKTLRLLKRQKKFSLTVVKNNGWAKKRSTPTILISASLSLILSFSLCECVCVCVCVCVTLSVTSSLTPSNLFLPISLSLCILFHHSSNFSVFICSLFYLYHSILFLPIYYIFLHVLERMVRSI